MEAKAHSDEEVLENDKCELDESEGSVQDSPMEQTEEVHLPCQENSDALIDKT